MTVFWLAAPKLHAHRLTVIAIFTLFIAFCCGPVNNPNATREFWRNSGFLSELPDQEEVIQIAIKTFQSVDVLFGAFVGALLQFTGPRVTHSLGYLFVASGTILMALPRQATLGMGLLATGDICLFSSALHLANLFRRGSKFAMSVLAGAVELSSLVFPAMNWAVDKGVKPIVALSVYAVYALVGIAFSLWLMPDSPFLPRSEALLAQMAQQAADPGEKQPSFEERDERDRWGDEGDPEGGAGGGTEGSNEAAPSERTALLLAAEQTPSEGGEGSIARVSVFSEGRLSEAAQRRFSALSVSAIAMGALEKTRAKPPLSDRNIMRQLFSTEWLLITSVFTFFVFRTNLYADGNEDILRNMGDTQGDYARLFANLMMFSLLSSLLNGVVTEFAGLLITISVLNGCAMAVNVLSLFGGLNLQVATFVFYIFSRASTWTFLFGYTMDILGLRNYAVLTGLSMVVAGIVNMTGGLAILEYVRRTETQKWDTVNWCLLGGGVATFGALLWLWWLDHTRPKCPPRMGRDEQKEASDPSSYAARAEAVE